MAEEKAKQQFAIQRLYIKDVSFEVPNAPDIFRVEWKPEMQLDMHTDSKKLNDEKHYEVVLKLTATVKSQDQTAFVAEVKQAGVFSIDGIEGEQLKQLLGSYCPNILYPYAREVITGMVSRGSFPQLVLAPINFDAVYEQYKKQQAEGGSKTGQRDTEHAEEKAN